MGGTYSPSLSILWNPPYINQKINRNVDRSATFCPSIPWCSGDSTFFCVQICFVWKYMFACSTPNTPWRKPLSNQHAMTKTKGRHLRNPTNDAKKKLLPICMLSDTKTLIQHKNLAKMTFTPARMPLRWLLGRKQDSKPPRNHPQQASCP